MDLEGDSVSNPLNAIGDLHRNRSLETDPDEACAPPLASPSGGEEDCGGVGPPAGGPEGRVSDQSEVLLASYLLRIFTRLTADDGGGVGGNIVLHDEMVSCLPIFVKYRIYIIVDIFCFLLYIAIFYNRVIARNKAISSIAGLICFV